MKNIIFGLVICGLFTTFESFSKNYDSKGISTLNNQRNLAEILNSYEFIAEEVKDNVRKLKKESEEEIKDFAYLLKKGNKLRKDIERRINILENLKDNVTKLNIQKKINELKNFNIDSLKISLSDLEKKISEKRQNSTQYNQEDKKNPHNQEIIESLNDSDKRNPQNQKIAESQNEVDWKAISNFQKDLSAFFIVLQKREAKLNTVLRLGHKLFDDTKKRNLFISQQDSKDEIKRLSYLIYQSRYPEALRTWNEDVKNIRGEKGFEAVQNMKKENKNKINNLLEKIQYLYQDVSNLSKLAPRKKKNQSRI